MKLSVLNVVPLRQGQEFYQAVDDMITLAQKVESYGYHRYWVAEHHNNLSLASSATQLLIQRLLDKTKRIRIGAGGVMLPNHSPYLVAEQYGTLDALYPNRLDLGLGRAPGTDGATAKAIRRKEPWDIDFEGDFEELQSYFDGIGKVKAFPADGRKVPYYILGSSLDSAHLAARLGLPYAFASHFAPAHLQDAADVYHHEFKPSRYSQEPYLILTLNIFLADTDALAHRLATTQIQANLDLITDQLTGLKPPKENEEEIWENYVKAKKVSNFGPVLLEPHQLIRNEKAVVKQMMKGSLIGSKETVLQGLKDYQKKFSFNELMAHSFIYDPKAQAHSYKLLAEIVEEL